MSASDMQVCTSEYHKGTRSYAGLEKKPIKVGRVWGRCEDTTPITGFQQAFYEHNGMGPVNATCLNSSNGKMNDEAYQILMH